MHYIYNTKDTCSSKIEFDIEENVVRNVEFTGGCNGNLKAIPVLIEGCKAQDIIEKLQGIKCGRRPTSCTDQLAIAISEAISSAI